MIPVLQENKELFDRMGITKWHEAGYDGSLGITMQYERPYVTPNMQGQVELLWSDQYPVYGEDTHAYWTTMVHLQVAPGRKIKSVISDCAIYPDNHIEGFLVDNLIPWIMENKPDTGFRSFLAPSGTDPVYSAALKFLTLCNAAGNSTNSGMLPAIADKAWLGVGAVGYRNGEFAPEFYSIESEYVDFCGIAPFYAPTYSGQPIAFAGTSCAAPFLSGIIALINHYFIKHIGRSLSFDEMYDFLKSICLDVSIPGKDVKTGFGVPILPDPATINPYKWVKHMHIEMPLHRKTITVDGQPMTIDTPITYDAGTQRLLAPVRVIAELAGFTVTWDDAKKTAILEK